MKPISEQELTAYLIDHQVPFYRFAYSYLQNPEDAMDAVQTTACRAIEKRTTLRSAQALSAWTRQILFNVCTDMLRRRSREIPVEQIPDLGCHQDQYHCDDTLLDRINALPIEVSTVIKLRFFEELSLKEISAVTGTNLNTVKTRLYAGLKKLRLTLEGEADDE